MYAKKNAAPFNECGIDAYFPILGSVCSLDDAMNTEKRCGKSFRHGGAGVQGGRDFELMKAESYSVCFSFFICTRTIINITMFRPAAVMSANMNAIILIFVVSGSTSTTLSSKL